MVFRRFSSLSRGDNDKLSASAMFKSCHKGIKSSSGGLGHVIHVIQLSGGLGQALKQSAQRFRSMFWLTKGILFASQEIKSMRFSWVCGPRQKDFGLEGCGRWMSDTWSSEIQKYAYGVMFQSLVFQGLSKLKKTKGLGRILPSGRRLPHHRLQNSLSELQNPPWFRFVDSGFGCFAGSDSNSGWFCEFCSNLWSGVLELRSDLECLLRVRFRVEVVFCSYAGCFQFWISSALGH